MTTEPTDRDRTLTAMLRGWALVALSPKKYPPPRRISPGRSPTTPPRIARALDQGHGVGFLPGRAPGVAVIDVDDAAVYAELAAMLGPLPPPWVQTGRNRLHHWVGWVPGLPATCSWQGRLLGEVKRGGADGQKQEQVVIPPTQHPDTTQPYVWLVDPVTAPVPALPPAWRAFLLAQTEPASGRSRPRPDDGWQKVGDLPPLDLIALTTAGGLYLKALGGGKHALRCFNEAQHTTPSSDTTTILWEPERAGLPWGFKCHHGHCSALGITALLDALGVTQDARTPPPPPRPDEPSAPEDPRSTNGFVDLGTLLRRRLPPLRFLVEGLLVDEGGGFVGGEEKSFKTMLAEHMTLCLALPRPVGGRFAVHERVRVLFVEEEDSLRRTQMRFQKMLRGFGLDPDDPAVQDDLSQWVHLSVWSGADLDSDAWWHTLATEVDTFRPAVAFFDCLSKLTSRNLSKSEEARPLLNRIDQLRRQYGFVAQFIHHYRKGQGERVGRGSQEIAGSYVLGAWSEQSLFLEPKDRTGKIISLVLQSKDAPPLPAPLRLVVTETDSAITLTLEDLPTDAGTAERVWAALGTATPSEPTEGDPGVSVKTLSLALKLSDKTVRRALKSLVAAGRAVVAGLVSNNTKLYAQTE